MRRSDLTLGAVAVVCFAIVAVTIFAYPRPREVMTYLNLPAWGDPEGSPDRPLGETGGSLPDGVVDVPDVWGLGAYSYQKLSWHPCGDGVDCATFLAPLDWSQPGDKAVTLSMARLRASGSRGTVFFNPGGPGGSAMAFVHAWDDRLSDYDVVGLDPRGSGQSTPVQCGSPDEIDEYLATDFSPDDETEMSELLDAQRRYNAQCRANSGELLDHVSSVEAIHDYELARILMGLEAVSFYGVSYGSYLGALYTQMYPDKLDRVILDSVISVDKDPDVSQAEGFDRALHDYAVWCAAHRSCSLGRAPDAVVDTIVGFMDGLDSAPIAVGDRMLTQSLAVTGLTQTLYGGEDAYPVVSDTVSKAMAGDGSGLLQAADSYEERRADGTFGYLQQSFAAIGCRDQSDKGVEANIDEWRSDSSVFARWWGPSVTCPLWPAPAESPVEFGPSETPILVLHNTGDPATPYDNVETFSSVLRNVAVISRDAPGHGAWDETGSCVDEAVNNFLDTGELPEGDVTCPA